MADLDDFFAKKDRKKSKAVKKFATADELAKKLDDPKQKSDVRPKKERPVQEGEEGGRAGSMTVIETNALEQPDTSSLILREKQCAQPNIDSTIQEDEEEWKEYEEPVKDYTGLKIQVLQGGNQQSESGRDSASEDTAPEGGKVKGPWNKPHQPEAEAPAPPPVEEPKPREVKPATYVPPSSRQRPIENVRRSTKHAPDIHNDDYFPVLGASAKRGGGGWSTAGGGAAREPTAQRQPLALGNRFTSLQDDS